jgi:hypothetical protein
VNSVTPFVHDCQGAPPPHWFVFPANHQAPPCFYITDVILSPETFAIGKPTRTVKMKNNDFEFLSRQGEIIRVSR